MLQHHYRDLIQRAVLAKDHRQLELIAAQFADAARAREILCAKGYGATGMTASATAAQIPVQKRGGRFSVKVSQVPVRVRMPSRFRECRPVS